MRTARRSLGRPVSALSAYSVSLGQLMERHMADAALVAARQAAEREAAEARQAKRQIEIANAALQREIAIRASTQSRLAHLASHDALTALPNRTLFADRLARQMEVARQHGQKLALLYVDLDNFKDVNDMLGHAAGDILLQLVSARISGELRLGETVARMGGDEFAVLQIDIAQAAQARALAERLIAVLSEAFEINARPVFIGASIGITLYPDDGDSAELLHRNADLALYRSKSEGRNRCHFFDQALNEAASRRARLEQALREPGLLAQMRLAFQPQVDVASERITGVESLLRWQHPHCGLIGPSEFIPLAERSGVIGDIGAWVLRESCRQAMRWRQAGLPPLTVAVNVAATQFRRDDMPRLVAEVLRSTGLPPCRLELEITETGIMHNMHVAVETLMALHQQGISLAIDDFGTGYSSLSYLRKLPVDRIKIDQSFVSDAARDEDAAMLVNAIVRLAHDLRLAVVAEGVATAADAAFVRGAGCDVAQGFHYGAPGPAEDLQHALAAALPKDGPR
jgi:diguanylate cyclase (GGDEF)-like protein